MFWYVLMCFMGSSGVHCLKVPAPSLEACINILPAMREYAYQRRLPAVVDCANNGQYT